MYCGKQIINSTIVLYSRYQLRKPFLLRAQIINESRVNTPDKWQAKWLRKRPEGIQVDNINTPILGMDLPRKIWVTLNRTRTGQGKCNELMYKWNSGM